MTAEIKVLTGKVVILAMDDPVTTGILIQLLERHVQVSQRNGVPSPFEEVVRQDNDSMRTLLARARALRSQGSVAGTTTVPFVDTASSADEQLTPAEVAKRVGVSESFVRRRCREGPMGKRHGGRWLITERECDDWKRHRSERQKGTAQC